MPVPIARKPAAAPDVNNALSGTRSATEQITGRHSSETTRGGFPALDAPARLDARGLNVGGLARQFNRLSIENAVETSAQGSVQGSVQRSVLNPAQRAVAAYVEVATQQHREELVELLGIDVFA